MIRPWLIMHITIIGVIICICIWIGSSMWLLDPVVYNQNRLLSSTQTLKQSTYLRTLMECEVSCKYSNALVTFSKSWCSILIVITFSSMLISVSSIVAPSLSPDGHTCSSRRFCTLIIWTKRVTSCWGTPDIYELFYYMLY